MAKSQTLAAAILAHVQAEVKFYLWPELKRHFSGPAARPLPFSALQARLILRALLVVASQLAERGAAAAQDTYPPRELERDQFLAASQSFNLLGFAVGYCGTPEFSKIVQPFPDGYRLHRPLLRERPGGL